LVGIDPSLDCPHGPQSFENNSRKARQFELKPHLYIVQELPTVELVSVAQSIHPAAKNTDIQDRMLRLRRPLQISKETNTLFR
jgi:hypothetical protein